MENKTIEASSRKTSELRRLGVVIKNVMLHSNSPLAQGYRKFLAEKVNAEKGGMA